jgi:hypothetical protein
MGNGSCEVSMLLAMDLMELQDIEILMRGVEGCQSSNVVQKWSDMYRDQGEYILIGVGRGAARMDGCPLTSPPLQRCSITMYEDLQDVAMSALVNGIKLKIAELMW